MLARYSATLLTLIFSFHGCTSSQSQAVVKLKYTATGSSPQILAVYEPWFGHPKHIDVGYSSHDVKQIRRQMKEATQLGISGFVVDWYGDREPFIDQSYALLQENAAKQHFKIAMMYDETDKEDGATEAAIADFRMFHDTYLSAGAPGSDAYLTYQGRPVIFIFPKGNHTDWARLRQEVEKWSTPPWLIYESDPGRNASAFDGFYAWVSPGSEGWKQDGSNWGQSYLDSFYENMSTHYPDKIIVGGAWAGFDDSRASWGLNRHMAQRCGATLTDTFNEWKKFIPASQPIPFLLIETWNDYEEGTAVERGIDKCPDGDASAAEKRPIAIAAAVKD